MKIKSIFFSALIVASLFTCSEDDDNLDGTGIVSFNNTELLEVENATAPLNISVGVDSFNHAGGTIELEITGAQYGVDYETNQGSSNFTLKVNPQALSTQFNLIPLDNSTLDGIKQLEIKIVSVTGALAIGESNILDFKIIDDERITINFSESSNNISENDGVFNINFTLGAQTTEDATITLNYSGDADSQDFNVNGNTSFPYDFIIPAGSTSFSLPLNIIDDVEEESVETIVLSIAGVQGGLEYGITNQMLTLTLLDNDTVQFNEVQTFETISDLSDINWQTVLINQDLPSGKVIKYNNNAGKYSDVANVNATSDSGMQIFYNITQNGVGTIDHAIITTPYNYVGNANISFDMAYVQQPSVNNAVIKLYVSETYNGDGNWNDSDWIEIDSETAQNLQNNGIGGNTYIRKTIPYTSNAPFYFALRLTQTFDNTFDKTQWRFDNLRIENQ